MCGGIGQASSIKNSHFAGNIHVEGNKSGIKEISGISLGVSKIENSYNIGNIEVYTNNDGNLDAYVSGIVGNPNNTIVKNCYNAGNLVCENPTIYLAGIIANAQNGSIINCHNIGNLKTIANIRNCGALTGFTRNEILEDCSWLIETAEKSIGGEDNNVTKQNVNRIDDINEMIDVLSIINNENAFKQDTNNINNGNPILTWQ